MMDHIFPKSRIVGERNEKLAHAEAQSRREKMQKNLIMKKGDE